MRAQKLRSILSLCYITRLFKEIIIVICICCFFYLAMCGWTPATRKVTVVQAPRASLKQDETCHRLLNDARLSNADDPWFYLNGCTMHNYTESDAQTCMRRISSAYGENVIGVVGDSRMRLFFVGLTKILGKTEWYIPQSQMHTDFQHYNKRTNTLVFYRLRGGMNSKILNDYQTWLESSFTKRPRVIIQAQVSWDITGTFEQSSAYFKGNFSKVIPYMEGITSSTDILWMLQDPTNARNMDNVTLYNRGPARMEAYNNLTVDLLSNSSVKIVRSSRSAALRFPDETDKWGIHYFPRVIFYKVQVFLNWYCNRHMDLPKGTCCSKLVDRQVDILTVRGPPVEHSTMIILLLVCILVILLIRLHRTNPPKSPPNGAGKSEGWKEGSMGKS